MRNKTEIGEAKAHVDYITDLAFIADSNQLVASSGDTSITVNDMCRLETTLQSHDGLRTDSKLYDLALAQDPRRKGHLYS